MMSMFETMLQGASKAAGGAGPAQSKKEKILAALPAMAKCLCWKQRLQMIIGKTEKANLAKDAFVYECTKLEGNTGFSCTLTCPHFKKEESYTAGRNPSKSKAENAVAKIAFAKEYGALFHAFVSSPEGKEADKKKTENEAPKEVHPKQELAKGLTLMLGRGLNKGELEMTYPEEKDMLVPTLKCPGMGGKTNTYKGTPIAKDAAKDIKKAAELAVVQKALVANKAVFTKKVAEHAKKKEAKLSEQQEKFKVRIAEIKAKEAAEKAAKKAA